MNKRDLQFVKDTLEMQRLFYEPSLHKTAQEGGSDVISSIKNYVSKMYDPKNPVESALSFLGPGLLWILGFPWIAVAYELAQALGFNWTEFFVSVKEKLRPFVQNLVDGKSGDSNEIRKAVETSATQAFGEHINPKEVVQVVNKYTSINNLLFIKKVSRDIRFRTKDNFMHEIEKFLDRGMGNRMRKGVLGFIIRIMSWVIAAGLISIGFALAGGLAAHVLGFGKKKLQEQKSEDTSNQSETVSTSTEPQQSQKSDIKLYLNPNADTSFFTTTYNDDSHVWLLNMNVGEVKDKLMQWAKNLYPQLSDPRAFAASSAFNRVLSMFNERNKGAVNLEILAVPEPFRSVKEIVDSFAYDVASHTSASYRTPNSGHSIDI